MTLLLIAAAWITVLTLITGLCAIAGLSDKDDSVAAPVQQHFEPAELAAWGLTPVSPGTPQPGTYAADGGRLVHAGSIAA